MQTTNPSRRPLLLRHSITATRTIKPPHERRPRACLGTSSQPPRSLGMKYMFLTAVTAMTLGSGTPALCEQIGRVGVDWVGNDIVIEAVADPKVAGVTCHIAYFDRSLIDRLQQGNWFEDPSNASIACRQTGPITIGAIDRSEDGEDVFETSRSLVLKSLRIKRILDTKNQTLIYLAHARDLTQGSAKMAISTVPLYGSGTAARQEGKP